MPKAVSSQIQLAFDIGGTFTDIIVQDGDRFDTIKVFTDSRRPIRAVQEALRVLLDQRPSRVLHGTTLATNTLLEKKGARTALLTTKGFEDVVEIGRQCRPSLYDIQASRPPPLVPRSLRVGISERTLADGSMERAVTIREVRKALDTLKDKRSQAVAVSFLHSPSNPSNEQKVGSFLEGSDLPYSLSHEVVPVAGEYERTAAAVANAYLLPKMGSYLRDMEHAWPQTGTRIMQSNGGLVSSETAARFPVQTVLSGPAAGVIGAFQVAKKVGIDGVITFDMGGTSTDVCLCDGRIPWTDEMTVGDIPIAVSMIDLITVGSGGGSLARIDSGGALRVGPESAGALPGPVCYGKGGKKPTLTDAHLFLGRMPPDAFLGGGRMLRTRGLSRIFDRLGSPVGLNGVRAALGVVEVANTIMEGALRKVSVERGHDPRDFTLVSFGGAGGLHACELAARLGIPRVLVPPNPGLLSAFGLILANVVRERSVSVLKILDRDIRTREIRQQARQLQDRLRKELSVVEGIQRSAIRLVTYVILRYRGQASGLPILLTEKLGEAFHHEHQKRYGFSRARQEVEVVRILVRAEGARKPPVSPIPSDASRCPIGSLERRRDSMAEAIVAGARHPVWFANRFVKTPVVHRTGLAQGTRLTGPAVVVEYSSTVVVPPGFLAEIDEAGNILVVRKGRS